MSTDTNTLHDWEDVVAAVSFDVAASVAHAIQQNSAALAEGFYAVMMADAEAAQFLSNEAVQSRLKPSIQRWMNLLFAGHGSDPVALAALQRQVGDVHARAEIPVGLVSRGMRHLKVRVRELLVRSELNRRPGRRGRLCRRPDGLGLFRNEFGLPARPRTGRTHR